jgi:aromatic ring-opening dioxygenase catalytic subunit (LigB family)
MNHEILELAILALGRDSTLLNRFKAAPVAVGAELGLDSLWAEVINRGDRDRLRSAGVPDGITILVSRWFSDNVGDSASHGTLYAEQDLAVGIADVPANLVFAGGCSHVPDLLARPEIDPPEAIARLLAGYSKLREDIARSNAEVLIATTDCHFQRFVTGSIVVGTADSHEGSMEFFKRRDLDLRVRGAPEFANEIVKTARAKGLEIEEAPEVRLDHGLIVPLRLLLPDAGLPVVPIVTQPARTFSPFGARVFGEALREAIARSNKRVAILATGGLSHWLDPGKFGFVDTEFDKYILSLLRLGRGLDLANLEPYPLLDHGQYEILNWIIMLGAVGAAVPGEVYAYEAMKASGGGWSVVNMRLGAGASAGA